MDLPPDIEALRRRPYGSLNARERHRLVQATMTPEEAERRCRETAHELATMHLHPGAQLLAEAYAREAAKRKSAQTQDT